MHIVAKAQIVRGWLLLCMGARGVRRWNTEPRSQRVAYHLDVGYLQTLSLGSQRVRHALADVHAGELDGVVAVSDAVDFFGAHDAVSCNDRARQPASAHTRRAKVREVWARGCASGESEQQYDGGTHGDLLYNWPARVTSLDTSTPGGTNSSQIGR